jgi:small subunit ribosomal protein S16
MVRIRLRRTGLKNQPTYRVVVADKESPRDGRFLEIIGSYNPRTNPATVDIKEDRVYEWMKKGAQPSLPALKVFNSIGLMDRYNRFKAGEKLEILLAEAKTPAAPKTETKKPSKKAVKAEKAAKEVAAKEKVKEEPAEKPAKEAAVKEKVKEEPVEKPAEKPEEKPAEEEKKE